MAELTTQDWPGSGSSEPFNIASHLLRQAEFDLDVFVDDEDVEAAIANGTENDLDYWRGLVAGIESWLPEIKAKLGMTRRGASRSSGAFAPRAGRGPMSEIVTPRTRRGSGLILPTSGRRRARAAARFSSAEPGSGAALHRMWQVERGRSARGTVLAGDATSRTRTSCSSSARTAPKREFGD
jgi:hypothetical protein